MGFFSRRTTSPRVGIFETTELIPMEEWDDKTAKRRYVLKGFVRPAEISPGLHVFRASHNQSYRHAVVYHNAAIERGDHSEFTEVDRRNWHVFVAATAPKPNDPLAGVSDAPPGSTQWMQDVAHHQRLERQKESDDSSGSDG
jgi:hypothetical protein